jgi:hypothetical protein
MPTVSFKKLSKAKRLSVKLVDRVDDGDQVLTITELYRATNVQLNNARNPVDQWTVDPPTLRLLEAAINKAKARGDRTLEGIKAGLDEALSELTQGKARTTLAGALTSFAQVHADSSVSSFEFRKAPGVYVPKTPFRAPPRATASAWVQAVVLHFNSYSNDNSQHGARPESITRYVLGEVETKAVVGEIAKLPTSRQRSILRELERRILQRDQWGFGELRRIYVDPKGQRLLDARAKALGLSVTFAGNPKAPKFDYY